jgi:hypothetical protein
MRRLLIVFLSLLEAAVGCAILASCLELSRDLERSATVGRVAHAVVQHVQRIALALRVDLGDVTIDLSHG